MTVQQASYAAYFNVARHNLLEVFNHIAQKTGLGMTDNDDQVGDHPLLKKLNEWGKTEEQNGRLNDKDIRVVKQVVKSLQKALPILGDAFAQNVSGQKIYLDVKQSLAQEPAHTALSAARVRSPRNPEKPIRVWRVGDLHWVLHMLTQQLMALRNYHSHAYQNKVGLGEPLETLLGLWFDAARREAKSRFEYLTHEMEHLVRVCLDEQTGQKIIDTPHAISHREQGARRLTDKGTAFFLCLFLDKQQGNEFLKQIPGFKYDASRPYQATLRTYTHWSIRMPFVRIETDSTPQSLALDMLSELARCPSEIYDNLSAEDKAQFDIAPESDESWMNADDAEGLTVRFIRHGNRFAPLLMDYFDHLTHARPEHDCGIRFALDLGDFYFAAYPKRLSDGSTDVRRLKQKVLRFGLRSEALQQADQKPKEWTELQRVNTERDYDQPYIVQTQPHYHFSEEGGSIPIQLKRDSVRYYDVPQIHPTKTNPDGSARYKTLPSERPDYWLSPFELVNLAFYHHLRTAHGLPECGFPRVDNLLKSYSSSLQRVYVSMKTKPNDWISDSSQALDAKLKVFCTEGNRSTYYTLRSKDLPSDLQALLLGKDKPADEQMHTQAQNTLALLVDDGDARMRDVQRAKQSLREGLKPGKLGHRVMRAGEMATFLAKDMLRLQPVQDVDSAHKGKPTSIMVDLLQARLAYFGRDKASLPALLNHLGLTGHEQADKNHPFLHRIGLQDQGMNGIAQFYEAYLFARQKHLKALQTQLKNQGPDALQAPAFAWLNLAQTPERFKNKNTIFNLIRLYLKRAAEPLNLPRGLFRELILKALMALNNQPLAKEVQQALDKEASRKMPTSVSYLIDLYFLHHQGDGYQEFYCYDMPRLQKRIDDAHAEEWAQTRWAETATKQLRSEQAGISQKELISRLNNLWKDRARKLSQLDKELAKRMRLRATQDQVLFLAAKRLMALNHSQTTATRKDKDARPDEAQDNPFEALKLQTLSRADLNHMVPHELRIVDKQDRNKSKTIYVEAIKVKNIGLFKRLVRDRRLSGLLHYYDAPRIHLSMVSHELQAYPRAQNQAFAQVLAFEDMQNARQKLQADALPKGQSLHRELVKQSLSKSLLPHDEQDRLQAEALTLRNAFCHNQTPAPENAKGNPTNYNDALPVLTQARTQLAIARQTGDGIGPIQGGNTVAEHFAKVLTERYAELNPQQPTPKKK